MQIVISDDQFLKKARPDTWLSSQEICLDKLKTHDKAAFRLLYKAYAPAIYGVILRNLNDERKCNAVLEQTFTQAWNTIDKYDATKCTLFTWLSRLASSEWNHNVV